MLIRSQNKERIIFTKDIDTLTIVDNGHFPYHTFLSKEPPKPYVEPDQWFIKTKDYTLGWYSSKEKAVAVLDLIQNTYHNQQKEFQERMISMISKYQPDVNDLHILNFLSPDCCLFVMPQDEEINVTTTIITTTTISKKTTCIKDEK